MENENKNYKILIVEDETLTSLYIEDTLKGYDFTILGPVNNGIDAINLAKNTPPDLILMDIVLEGPLDGIETVKKIKKIINVPIIYITAVSDNKSMQRAKLTAPFGFLIKPVNSIDIYSTIKMALYKFNIDKNIIESEEKYHSLFENLSNAYIYCKVISNNKNEIYDAEIIETNYQFLKLIKKEKIKVLGKNITEIFQNLDNSYENWQQIISKVILTNKSNKLKIHLKKINKWFMVNLYSPMLNHIVIILDDITETIIAEQKLLENENKYRSLHENMRDAYAHTTLDGKIIDFNNEFVKLLGYKTNEISKLTYEDITPEKWHQMEFDIVNNQVMKRGYSDIYEKEYIQKDGSIIPIELRVYLVKDFNQNPTGMWALVRETTERKKHEADLKEAHQEIYNLLSSIDSILIGISKDNIVTHWNSIAEDIFQISNNDAIGKNITKLTINWNWKKINSGISESLIKNKSIQLNEITFEREDSNKFILGLTINPIFDQNQKNTGFLIYGTDITEKKVMEMQLLQDQKLKSIGELAAGIAHEINTPTQFVSDNIVFFNKAFNDLTNITENIKNFLKQKSLSEKCNKEISLINKIYNKIDYEYLLEEIPQALTQTEEGLKRVSSIVNSLKQFTYMNINKLHSIEINKAIQDTLAISRNEWKYDVKLDLNFDDSNPHVECFPNELNQVILNIIVNATHAIKSAKEIKLIHSGIITISTRKYDNYLEITIGDNGIGIPENYRNRIFDPFFTTKGVGKGTGQGLAIAHSIIVNKHKGSLTFETQEGKGTKFIIHLPLIQIAKENVL